MIRTARLPWEKQEKMLVRILRLQHAAVPVRSLSQRKALLRIRSVLATCATFRLYGLLLRILERIRESPSDPKLRSISASAKSLRADVLEVPSGLFSSRLEVGVKMIIGDRRRSAHHVSCACRGTLGLLCSKLRKCRHGLLGMKYNSIQQYNLRYATECFVRVLAVYTLGKEDTLDKVDGGPELLRWAGFQHIGDRCLAFLWLWCLNTEPLADQPKFHP